MKEREFLRQATVARDRIGMLREQLDRLREDMSYVRRSVLKDDSVQSSTPHDLMGDRVADVCDKIAVREKQLEHWGDVLYSVESAINGIECATCGRVLYLRYVKGLTLEEVAAELGYSGHYIRELHTKGIKEISSLLEGSVVGLCPTERQSLGAVPH